MGLLSVAVPPEAVSELEHFIVLWIVVKAKVVSPSGLGACFLKLCVFSWIAALFRKGSLRSESSDEPAPDTINHFIRHHHYLRDQALVSCSSTALAA